MKKNLIKKSLWLGFALTCFLIGLFICIDQSAKEGLAGYFMFGFCCIFPIIGFFFRLVSGGAKAGRKSGAENYTATQTGSTITVENHPFMGWIIGIVLGAIIGLLIGPIFLPIRMIIVIKDIIVLAIQLKKEKNN